MHSILPSYGNTISSDETQLLADAFPLAVRPLRFRNDSHRHAEFIRGVDQVVNEAVVPGRLCV